MYRKNTKNPRRRHQHFRVTVTYTDEQIFRRVYTNADLAERFAERQRKSPVVKMASVEPVG